MESKMKYLLLNILLAFSLGIIISCSELKSNLPVETAIPPAHGVGFADPTSQNFHGIYIANNNWNIQQCQTCHAANFSGGTTGVSCNSCHTFSGGPASCNTCHGVFNDSIMIAPPRALNGDTATSYIAVGAHTSHLYSNRLSVVPCASCHNVPQSVFSSGHINSSSLITLQGLATTNIAYNAKFSPNGSCANTYCHGNFSFTKASALPENYFAFTDSVMVGNNITVQWTQVGESEAVCGSCHDLPPKGHIGYQENWPISSCVSCHAEVVDANGNIIDKTKHINGQVDVRAN